MKISKLISVGVLSTFLLASCSSKKETDKKNVESDVTVQVALPNKLQSNGMYLSGQTTAKQTAAISTRMMGYVKKIHVKPGDVVSAGQQLVTVSSDELLAKKAQAQAMLTEAEAASKNAEKDLERFKSLHASNSVSDKELENVSLQNTSMKAKVQMAKQQLNEVNAMMNYTNIKAPFSGTITQKMMDEGGMANPGMPILMMEQSGDLQIKASVPESYIKYVKVGDMVKIDVKAINKTFPAEIVEVSPSAHGTGGQYGIKIDIDKEYSTDILPGMYVNIFIERKTNDNETSKLMIDKNALVYRDQLTGVYVIGNDDTANLRWVRLGKTEGDQVEVLSGLNSDERVVTNTDSKLHNGIKVKISN